MNMKMQLYYQLFPSHNKITNTGTSTYSITTFVHDYSKVDGQVETEVGTQDYCSCGILYCFVTSIT